MSGQSTHEERTALSLIKVIKTPFKDTNLEPAYKDEQMAASVQRVLEAHIKSGINTCMALQNSGNQNSPLRVAIEENLPRTFSRLFAYLGYCEGFPSDEVSRLRLAMDFMRNGECMLHHRMEDLVYLMKNVSVFCDNHPGSWGIMGLIDKFNYGKNCSWFTYLSEELKIREEARMAHARAQMYGQGVLVPIDSRASLTYYYDQSRILQCTPGTVPDGCEKYNFTEHMRILGL